MESAVSFGSPSLIAQSDLIRYSSLTMKTLSVTHAARNFSRMLDQVERNQEEIVLVRNRRRIARLIPEPPDQNALEVMGDLYRTLTDADADSLLRSIERFRNKKNAKVSALKNPWVS